MYRCVQCDGGVAYCITCKSSHIIAAGHDLYLDARNNFHHRGVCVRCEQAISTTWYQPKDNPEGRLMKVCENCAGIQRSGASDDSWACEYVHMNEWEHMAKPEGVTEFGESGVQLHKPEELLPKIATAQLLLCVRPYFSRLWVR